MAEIKPRWEWRSFGERFGPAEAHIAKLSPTGVQESDELYLLSGAGANVKVRDALMDIKVLREVNADALEQWTPVMKGSFPLPAAEVAQVLQALGLPLPDPVPDALTQEDFMARFAAPGGAVRAVPVHKRRVRYVIGGCTAELSEVTAAGRTHAHAGGGVGGCGGGDRRGAQPRPGRLGQHQLSARPGGAGRRQR